MNTKREDNVGWKTKKFGFCRPGWAIPYYYSQDELGKFDLKRFADEVEVHTEMMSQMYVACEKELDEKEKERWTSMNVLRPAKRELRQSTGGNSSMNPWEVEDDIDPPPDEGQGSSKGSVTSSKKAGPVSSKQWSCSVDWLSRYGSHTGFSYDFSESVAAGFRLRGKVVPEQESGQQLSSSDDDLLFRGPPAKRRRVTFTPNDRISKSMNKALKAYDNELCMPTFAPGLEVNLNDFPDSMIAKEPPKPCADKCGKYPRDDDVIQSYQCEVMRLESMNRALVKLHETDEFLLTALFKKLYCRSDVSDEGHVVDGLRNNFVAREKLLAESTAICLAVRRRDNAKRVGQRSERLVATVSRPHEDGDALLSYTE